MKKLLFSILLTMAVLTVSMRVTPVALAQSITSGDISGTITDPTGAVLADVTINLKNVATGAVQTTKTTSQGTYRFAFLGPGRYLVSVAATGFAEAQRYADVLVGQVVTASIQLALATSKQTVDVSEATVAVQTENGDISTTFTTMQVAELPNPGNDTTYIALTAPGVVANTGGGYGNFSTFGLPATSNLFTTNGQNNMDPYLNLNNSGATNLSLGKNEIAEASVINNGYSGQYGQMAGSQVNSVTKSGTNQFHGNAVWYWAGSKLASNDFFANQAGNPKTFFNDNQWADSIGGPIWKNKTFFFFNNEGIRIILPAGSTLVKIPSPQFEAATLANLTGTGQTAAAAFYQKAFSLYNSPVGLSGGAAVPVPGGGCGSGANAFTKLGAGVPCALQFRQFANTFTHERVWSLRIDQQIGKNDRLFARYYDDNGLQATGTDPINTAFSAFSPQPAYQGQLSETHTFGARAVNQFLFSGFYYSAIFGQPDYKAAVNTFPAQLGFTGGFFSTLAPIGAYPQGRVVKQWQYVDDFSLTTGNHSIKVGFNFHRNPFTDIGAQSNNVGTITSSNLLDFYSGGGVKDQLTQVFPTAPSSDFTYDQFGAYVQDEWRIAPSFKLNAALRIDRNGNLQCNKCFAELAQPFNSLSHATSIAYNQVIVTGKSSAALSADPFIWEPRLGFAWSPKFMKGTVIRGGAGVFGDSIPLTALVPISRNSPNLFSATAKNLPLTPGVPGGLFAATAATNAAFQSQFSSGATYDLLAKTVTNFSAPRETTSDSPLRTPRFYEWNIEVQKELPWSMVFSANYVGNHGSKLFLRNFGLNAYCDLANCGGFAGLPTSSPDPRFGRITQYQSSGISNYDGITVSVRRRFSHGFLFNFNYSYGHALDEISNGGDLPFVASTNVSDTAASNPYNIRKTMYGNADYDVRHNFTANYVWEDALRHMFHWGPNVVFSGWTISGDLFHRTGLPFTVIDTGTSAGFTNFSGNVYAQITGPVSHSCGSSAVDTPCFSDTAFASPTGYSNQGRNQFFGPSNTNFNLNITKNFRITERIALRLGVSFYNLFNHPNFDQPNNDIGGGFASQGGTFGTITSTVGPPTSIFGAFVGSQNAPRDIQFRTEIRF
jgi:Carboxypeptidase regulatory-like domain/TonB dependent receptor